MERIRQWSEPMAAEPASEAEVERLFALVREALRRSSDAAELDEVPKAWGRRAKRRARFAPVRLESSDEPFSPFIPYRADP